MPSIVTLGDKLIRINFDNNRIELSTTGGLHGLIVLAARVMGSLWSSWLSGMRFLP